MLNDPETIVTICARAAHEANRAYCVALGDETQPPWEQLSAELQDSTREGVRRAIDGATPEQLHESWVANRTASGWIRGVAKDNVGRTHPNLVPYAELPAAQKAKDELLQSVVKATLAALQAGLPPEPDAK